MRIAIYEWCMSGGLAGGDADIAREGRMMLEALAADAAKDPALDVRVLVEAGRAIDLPDGARVVTVAPDGGVPAVVAAGCDADWLVVVAPETDGILASLVGRLRTAGCRVPAPTSAAIAIAADKQVTIDALAARGVPVPAGRALAGGQSVPAGFHMPAVRKLRGSCGGDGLEVLTAHPVTPAASPTRIEAHVDGTPVGVSCICGGSATTVLPPLRQVFTAGRSPRYLGGDLVADAALAARAADLARRVAAALAIDAGWLGVDMILGDRADGRDDRVLEANPRITTSFVGLARLFSSSLVATMIDAAAGMPRLPTRIPQAAASAARFRVPDA